LISAPHVPHRKTISRPWQISTMERLYREFGLTSPHHQEHAGRTETLCLLGYRFGGRLAEHHLFHLAEDHASR
jgi:hypothetical protein